MRDMVEVVYHAEDGEDLPCSGPYHHPCADLFELPGGLIHVDADVWVPRECDGERETADTSATIHSLLFERIIETIVHVPNGNAELGCIHTLAPLEGSTRTTFSPSPSSYGTLIAFRHFVKAHLIPNPTKIPPTIASSGHPTSNSR